MHIIDKVSEKIKSFIHHTWFDEIIWVLVLVCVSFISFSLGIQHEQHRFLADNPISVSVDAEAAGIWKHYQDTKKQDAYFYASKNGTNYYTRDCTAGNRILDENRVYFTTSKEAEDVGYVFSKQC